MKGAAKPAKDDDYYFIYKLFFFSKFCLRQDTKDYRLHLDVFQGQNQK